MADDRTAWQNKVMRSLWDGVENGFLSGPQFCYFADNIVGSSRWEADTAAIAQRFAGKPETLLQSAPVNQAPQPKRQAK